MYCSVANIFRLGCSDHAICCMNAWIYYSVYYLIFVPLAFIYTKMFCGWDLKDYGAQFGHKKPIVMISALKKSKFLARKHGIKTSLEDCIFSTSNLKSSYQQSCDWILYYDWSYTVATLQQNCWMAVTGHISITHIVGTQQISTSKCRINSNLRNSN